VVVLLRPAIEHTRIPARVELPVELEVEVPVLFLGHEVCALALLDEDTVRDLPARGDILGLVAAPARGGAAVEEGLPLRGALDLGGGGLLGGRRRRDVGGLEEGRGGGDEHGDTDERGTRGSFSAHDLLANRVQVIRPHPWRAGVRILFPHRPAGWRRARVQ
jgi:hypothetical protein